MSHRIRALVALALVSFALPAAACTDVSGPRPDTKPCDTNNSNTCH